MTQQSPRIRQTRGPDKPLIAAELSRLREKPPRATSREPVSQLDRLAILNGLRDGDAPVDAFAPRSYSFPRRKMSRVQGEGLALISG